MQLKRNGTNKEKKLYDLSKYIAHFQHIEIFLIYKQFLDHELEIRIKIISILLTKIFHFELH